MPILYLGYLPEGPAEQHIADIFSWYKNKTGHAPTVIVVGPDCYPEYDTCPIVVRSRKAMAYGVLVSHTISPDQIDTPQRRLLEASSDTTIEEIPDLPVFPILDPYKDAPSRYESPNRLPGRPKRSGGICPHCQSKIFDFNKLGWWHGWKAGVYPPYWDELRSYVFQRDNYICTVCGKRFSRGQLVAHHIIPKEDGGPDSALNLTTMCHDCHPDNRPIMPE